MEHHPKDYVSEISADGASLVQERRCVIVGGGALLNTGADHGSLVNRSLEGAVATRPVTDPRRCSWGWTRPPGSSECETPGLGRRMSTPYGSSDLSLSPPSEGAAWRLVKS